MDCGRAGARYGESGKWRNGETGKRGIGDTGNRGSGETAQRGAGEAEKAPGVRGTKSRTLGGCCLLFRAAVLGGVKAGLGGQGPGGFNEYGGPTPWEHQLKAASRVRWRVKYKAVSEATSPITATRERSRGRTLYSTFEMLYIDRHREEEFTLTPKKRPGPPLWASRLKD